mmetsp:Transcript_114887/g.357909  ORF Transcript_114887/g.357909 Transcript_114887/m.357909 type:complete len:300 (-) Transcript_114887:533-1432(-)
MVPPDRQAQVPHPEHGPPEAARLRRRRLPPLRRPHVLALRCHAARRPRAGQAPLLRSPGGARLLRPVQRLLHGWLQVRGRTASASGCRRGAIRDRHLERLVFHGGDARGGGRSLRGRGCHGGYMLGRVPHLPGARRPALVFPHCHLREQPGTHRRAGQAAARQELAHRRPQGRRGDGHPLPRQARAPGDPEEDLLGEAREEGGAGDRRPEALLQRHQLPREFPARGHAARPDGPLQLGVLGQDARQRGHLYVPARPGRQAAHLPASAPAEGRIRACRWPRRGLRGGQGHQALGCEGQAG